MLSMSPSSWRGEALCICPSSPWVSAVDIYGGESYTCKMYGMKMGSILLVSGFHVSPFSQMFSFAEGWAACSMLLFSSSEPQMEVGFLQLQRQNNRTKTFSFTEDYGEAFTGNNEGRLCENMWSFSLQFLWDIWSKEVYGEASRTFIVKVRLEHATLKTRMKLLLSHLGFSCSCVTLVVSHLFKVLKTCHLVFLLWAWC